MFVDGLKWTEFFERRHIVKEFDSKYAVFEIEFNQKES